MTLTHARHALQRVFHVDVDAVARKSESHALFSA
jgi:hypothetical protein